MAIVNFTRNQPPTHDHVRAEDVSTRTRWTALCEGVLLPLGSIFAIFLCMLGVMLIVD
jgi:hypothetical protein